MSVKKARKLKVVCQGKNVERVKEMAKTKDKKEEKELPHFYAGHLKLFDITEVELITTSYEGDSAYALQLSGTDNETTQPFSFNIVLGRNRPQITICI